MMEFYVIYSFDVTKDQSVKAYQPPNLRKWDWTEGDGLYEYDYLGAAFKNGKHRKYCAMLTKKDFLELIRQTGMTYEDVETMGSLTELGWLPAMSFNGDSMHYQASSGLIYQNAYVTPFPQPVRDFHAHDFHAHDFNQPSFWPLTEEEQTNWFEKREAKTWDRLKCAVKEMFS